MDKATAERALNIQEDPYTKTILVKCYRKAVMVHHPDSPTGNHEKMIEVNAAYEYLEKQFNYNTSVRLSAQEHKKSWEEVNAEFEEMLRRAREQKRREEERVKAAEKTAREAAETIKDFGSSVADAADAVQDFAEAYEDFVWKVGRTDWSPQDQWNFVSETVDEVESKKETFAKQTAHRTSVRGEDADSGRDEPEGHIAKFSIAALIGFRILFFVLSIGYFISVGSWDFILNFGTFHFMEYWAGDFVSFFVCTGLVLLAGWNLLTGMLTDWIGATASLVYEWKRKGS